MKIDEHEQQRICEIQGEDGQLFNLEALRKEYSPVFIVQDRAVVKMLAAAGYEAVGLEDPANAEEVRNALERSKTRPGLLWNFSTHEAPGRNSNRQQLNSRRGRNRNETLHHKPHMEESK